MRSSQGPFTGRANGTIEHCLVGELEERNGLLLGVTLVKLMTNTSLTSTVSY